MILSDFEIEALLLSLKVAGWSVALALPVAVAAGWVLARSQMRGKVFLDALVHLPLVLPPVATGYLLLLVMGRQGFIGSLLDDWLGIVVAFRWTGAVLAAMVMAFPLMVRPIRLAIEAVDANLEEAAHTLGASRIAVFATITLPLALPGILAGAIMGFAKALGEFGATITFVANIPGETRTLPLAIHAFLQIPGSETASLRLTVVALAVSLGALIASELVARRLFAHSRR
ncbi:MAG: molybdate ABC transporter permease subunit [Alphaproteobacteria bacterium]